MLTDGRTTDAGVTGILIAHLRAFGSGELKKEVQEALILMTTDAVHVVYWFFFQWMASISFASESLMDPRIQVKLDKYQKCGNIISQTSLLSSYTGSETDADSDSR